MSVHPTAIVDPGVELGRDVDIGPYAVLYGPCELGDGCRIGPHVVIHPGVRMGRGCAVHAHAVLGDLPQDLSFEGGESYLQIGDRTIIREGVTLHRGTKPGTVTRIGDDCFLMNNCHCAHNVTLGNRVILANNALLAGYVEVGDGAFLSGNVSVQQFTRLGRLSMMGGNSAISKDLPPFCTTRSVKANTVLGLNTVGMRRAGMKGPERDQVKEAFRILYRRGLPLAQAVELIRRTVAEGPAREMADFAAASPRGIVPIREPVRLSDERR